MSPGPGTYVTERVRLVHPLRDGAMGSVWIADHETLKSQVVVKLVSPALLESKPEARTRFAREAAATAVIKSPHVIQIYDYGEMADGTPYMVMELLDGESLHERIEREGRISPSETAEILRQVGNALDLAHAHGIIHRDIKPQNIFVSNVHGEPHAKVLDFGIAKRASEESVELTNPGMIVGTVYYVCPERLEGEGESDFRTDLWALAVVAYKALTGELPFMGHDMVEVCTAIRQSRFRLPSKHRPELPASLDEWFVRAFFPDPEARFNSAAQMARTFKEALEPRAAERGLDGRAASIPAARPGARSTDPARPMQAIASLVNRLASGSREGDAGLGTSTAGAVASTTSTKPSVERVGWRVGLLVAGAAVAVVAVGLGVRSLLASPVALPAGAGPATGETAAASTATAEPLEVGTADVAESGAATTESSAPELGTAVRPSATSGAGAPPAPSGTAASSADAAEMILVPAGPFWMGCDAENARECSAAEIPGREVLLGAFLIDRTEVSTTKYRACVEAQRCSPEHLEHTQLVVGARFVASPGCNWGKPDGAELPINCVDHAQAQAYCAFAGKRLPTEAEWEKAARGSDRRSYPWGEAGPSCELAVMSSTGGGCGRQQSWPVGTQPGDKSPAGVLDLGGNVREWVADWYEAGYYRVAPAHNPPGPAQGVLRGTRGGSWTDMAPKLFRATTRGAQPPAARFPALGFRCAQSVP